MRDPLQVLRQKEAELVRVRKEVESLNTVAPLLADDDRTSPDDPTMFKPSNKKRSASAETSASNSQPTSADVLSSSRADSDSPFLEALKRAM